MSRPIKFRAWDGKQWREDFYLDYEGRVCLVDYCKEGEPHTVVEWDIVEFTGLSDKNNEPIFESDVVKYEEGEENGMAVIEWVKGGFVFMWIFQNTPSPSIWTSAEYMGYAKALHVIGNIHENPELLESNNENAK